jgi:hypothetical protein
MNPSVKRILITVMAVVFLLGACAPAPAPTQDPAQVQQQVEQSVALTVAAQNAQTEAAQPVEAPATNTPLPTQTQSVPPTPTIVLPTATPFVIVPPTAVVSSGGSSSGGSSGGGSVPINRDYVCDAINKKPADNTVFKPDADFDVKWTIVNTGTKDLRAGLDLKYFSGPQMTTLTRVELPALKPGEKYEVILDAEAPTKPGFHVMTWMVEGQLCYPYIAINVQK